MVQKLGQIHIYFCVRVCLCKIFVFRKLYNLSAPQNKRLLGAWSQAVKHFLEYFCLHVVETEFMHLRIILEQSTRLLFCLLSVAQCETSFLLARARVIKRDSGLCW